jgi:hypothetical protein
MRHNPEPPTSPPDEPLDVCAECGHLREDCRCPLEYCEECGALLPGDVHELCGNCQRDRRRRWLENPKLDEKERVAYQEREQREIERLRGARR